MPRSERICHECDRTWSPVSRGGHALVLAITCARGDGGPASGVMVEQISPDYWSASPTQARGVVRLSTSRGSNEWHEPSVTFHFPLSGAREPYAREGDSTMAAAGATHTIGVREPLARQGRDATRYGLRGMNPVRALTRATPRGAPRALGTRAPGLFLSCELSAPARSSPQIVSSGAGRIAATDYRATGAREPRAREESALSAGPLSPPSSR